MVFSPEVRRRRSGCILRPGAAHLLSDPGCGNRREFPSSIRFSGDLKWVFESDLEYDFVVKYLGVKWFENPILIITEISDFRTTPRHSVCFLCRRPSGGWSRQ